MYLEKTNYQVKIIFISDVGKLVYLCKDAYFYYVPGKSAVMVFFEQMNSYLSFQHYNNREVYIQKQGLCSVFQIPRIEEWMSTWEMYKIGSHYSS